MRFWRWLRGYPPVTIAPQRRSPPVLDRPRLPGQRPGEVRAPSAIFTPTQPKAGSRQVTGRQPELRRILRAVGEDRSHVVLYSERGRGKTSLANMVVETLRRNSVVVARHTCDAGSDFDSIIRGLMQDLPSSLLASPAAGQSDGCEAALPGRPLRPTDVAAIPTRLTCRGLVCLVDEFDRIADTVTRTRFADTIKQISDREIPLLFLLVGVSENLDELLGQHPSIQRNILGVHLPLFTDSDIAEVITKGGRESGFDFPAVIINRISLLSRGMPYMAQLLGLRLTQVAAERGSGEVSLVDLEAVTGRLLADANPRVTALYDSLTQRGHDMGMVRSLRNLATVPQDPFGRIVVTRLADGQMSASGRLISQSCWTRLIDAGALAPIHGDAGLFTFADRWLMYHILLLTLSSLPDPNAEAAEFAGETEMPAAARRESFTSP